MKNLLNAGFKQGIVIGVAATVALKIVQLASLPGEMIKRASDKKHENKALEVSEEEKV